MGVAGDKHRGQRWGDRLAAALADGGDGPLADGFGVGGGMPRPWRVKALRALRHEAWGGVLLRVM